MAQTPLSKEEFWQRAAAFGFSLWALMLPIAVGFVIASLGKFADKMEAYVLSSQQQLTLLKERQDVVLRNLDAMHQELRDHDSRLDRLEGKK